LQFKPSQVHDISADFVRALGWKYGLLAPAAGGLHAGLILSGLSDFVNQTNETADSHFTFLRTPGQLVARQGSEDISGETPRIVQRQASWIW
jgi:hypothetical protein